MKYALTALILFAATPAMADGVRIVVPTHDIARGDTMGETDLTYANVAGAAMMSGVATSLSKSIMPPAICSMSSSAP